MFSLERQQCYQDLVELRELNTFRKIPHEFKSPTIFISCSERETNLTFTRKIFLSSCVCWLRHPKFATPSPNTSCLDISMCVILFKFMVVLCTLQKLIAVFLHQSLCRIELHCEKFYFRASRGRYL